MVDSILTNRMSWQKQEVDGKRGMVKQDFGSIHLLQGLPSFLAHPVSQQLPAVFRAMFLIPNPRGLVEVPPTPTLAPRVVGPLDSIIAQEQKCNPDSTSEFFQGILLELPRNGELFFLCQIPLSP